MDVAGLLEEHRAAGRTVDAGGVPSFVREQGDPSAEPVVCVHGVPMSSFLWRKTLPELAARGLRGVAVDLPGLGFAERPEEFDYSWTGLGRWLAAAVDALGIDRYHLLVHDIGGPVGFELAAAQRERVRSLLVLNTIGDVDRFRRPWFMQPYATAGLGPAWLASTTPAVFRGLMYTMGVRDRSAISGPEIEAHVRLLKRDDGGAAFLRIMRGFERTPAKGELYRRVLGDGPYPVGILWGADDPSLTPSREGEQIRLAAGLPDVPTVPGRHFLPEEQPAAIAEHVVALAARA